jgi:hypothetical protein
VAPVIKKQVFKEQRPRGAPPPKADSALARALIKNHGARGAARRLDMPRATVVAIAAEAWVLLGTLALFRERVSSLPSESSPEVA